MQAPQRRMTKPRAKYPLTGIARCGRCGGAIIGARQKRGHESVKVYEQARGNRGLSRAS
jgi:hypothetical protein